MLDYKIENERKAHQGYVAYYEGVLALLNELKFITKKDGKPYQTLSKNIDLSEVKGVRNATVCTRAISYDISGGNELHFSFYDKLGKWQELNIPLHEFDFRINEVEPERLIRQSYLRPYYIVNFEDLKFIVDNLKNRYQKWLIEENNVLFQLDDAIKMATQFEKDFQKKYGNTSLWWIVKEALF